MLAYEENLRYLFIGKKDIVPEIDGHISKEIREYLAKNETFPRLGNLSVADRMAGFLSWYYDINYQYSIDFCKKLNVTSRLVELFKQLCVDEDCKQILLAKFTDFLQHHQFLR